MEIHKPRWLYGFHDPGGEHLMVQANRRGWILFTEAVGYNPSDISSRDYSQWADQGFGIIVRLNNGYGTHGTIPRPEHYSDFARRVANFVSRSKGCHIWIIGNEPNHEQERPHGQPISAWDYCHCYAACRNVIKNVRPHDEVIMAAVAPWNDQTKYTCNDKGDWLLYFQHMVEYFEDSKGVDGFALHSYTHGPDPALVNGGTPETSLATMNPPWEDRYFQWPHYRQFLDRIPEWAKKLPVYITEANQGGAWAQVSNGWVVNAYRDINWWNERYSPKILCCLLYRWPNVPGDIWGIEGNHGVMTDFKNAMAFDCRWDYGTLPPDPEPPDPDPEDPCCGDLEARVRDLEARVLDLERRRGHRQEATAGEGP